MRRLLSLALLSLVGCIDRGCQSPVGRNETVYLRGPADPEIKLVLMDDKWGTEDRTASVQGGRYEFAWTGRDLTAFLGGERSFRVRAPAEVHDGEPYIESSEFFLRRTIDLPLHLWKPKVAATTHADGSLHVLFDPLDSARQPRSSGYRMVVGFSRSVTRIDGTRDTDQGSVSVAGSPSGTTISSDQMLGRDREAVSVTLEATGGDYPTLTYTARRQEVSLPVPPEERLALAGTAEPGVTQVRVRDAANRSRSVTPGAGGAWEFVWTGRQLGRTLGQTTVFLEAGTSADPARVVARFRLGDVPRVPTLRLWDPIVSASSTGDGGLSLRFAPEFAGAARHLARMRYSQLDRDGELRPRVESVQVSASGTTLWRQDLERILPDRGSEDIEVRVEAETRDGLELVYSSAGTRVRVPVTGSRKLELNLGAVSREFSTDEGVRVISWTPVLHLTVPLQDFARVRSDLRNRQSQLRARVAEVFYAKSRLDLLARGTLEEELRRELNLLMGSARIDRVELTDYDTRSRR